LSSKSPPEPGAVADSARLRARLDEVEETLNAIRSGQVDALVVEGTGGPQIYTLQGLDAETNRFRGEMLDQVNDAVIAIDRENCIIYLNCAAERLYGLTASEALGQTLPRIYTCRWGHEGDEAAAAAALLERGEWRGENVHVRRDGIEIDVESSITMLRDVSGRPTGILSVIRDVTERKRNEDKVLVSEIRYRRLFETAHDGVLLLDPATRKIIDANPFMTEMLGYSQDQLVGNELFEIGLLKDEPASREMVRKLSRNHQVRYDDLPLRGKGGRHHEVEVVANLYDEGGQPIIQCNVRDITARKQSEEQVKLLMAEVNHRAKNLLAVVLAVAQQTARYGDLPSYVKRLSDRIDGLAAGQDLLVRNQWQGVEVSDLVKAQLAHFKDLIGTRILMHGPRVQFTAAAAQGVGMALHELATNASKYGALSNFEGRVDISWHITTAAKPVFSMSWTESGGPKVVEPAHKGFGQLIIGRMAEASVLGTAEIRFHQTGLSWTLCAATENALTGRDQNESAHVDG
jgi:PAS domain S-box-containing protein